jgi:hypothetical protein
VVKEAENQEYDTEEHADGRLPCLALV